MLTDYLSPLPSSNPNIIASMVNAFDPFQADLIDLQKADSNLQHMNQFQTTGTWPKDLSKSDSNYVQNLAVKLYQDASKIV
jgi:hypothetical protein